MVHAGRSILLLHIFVLTVVALAALPAHAKDVRRHVTRPVWKQVTRASWYGRDFQGRRTAGGTNFNPQDLTAAHRTLGLVTRVKVTELQSGHSVVVQIPDRGPYLRGRGIDLSYAAARQLGIVRRGVARVKVELLVPDEPVASAPIVTASWWPTASWLPKAIVEYPGRSTRCYSAARGPECSPAARDASSAGAGPFDVTRRSNWPIRRDRLLSSCRDGTSNLRRRGPSRLAASRSSVEKNCSARASTSFEAL